MPTDEELEMRAALFLPLIGTAQWQRDLAVKVMRELADSVRERLSIERIEAKTQGGCRPW